MSGHSPAVALIIVVGPTGKGGGHRSAGCGGAASRRLSILMLWVSPPWPCVTPENSAPLVSDPQNAAAGLDRLPLAVAVDTQAPIERGRYICRRPAFANASAMAVGTRRSLSHSSRAPRTCGTRRRAPSITSASAGIGMEGGECNVTMLAPGAWCVPPNDCTLHGSIQSAGDSTAGFGEQAAEATNPDSLDTRRRSKGVRLLGMQSMPSGKRSADRSVSQRFLGGQ